MTMLLMNTVNMAISIWLGANYHESHRHKNDSNRFRRNIIEK